MPYSTSSTSIFQMSPGPENPFDSARRLKSCPALYSQFQVHEEETETCSISSVDSTDASLVSFLGSSDYDLDCEEEESQESHYFVDVHLPTLHWQNTRNAKSLRTHLVRKVTVPWTIRFLSGRKDSSHFKSLLDSHIFDTLTLNFHFWMNESINQSSESIHLKSHFWNATSHSLHRTLKTTTQEECISIVQRW